MYSQQLLHYFQQRHYVGTLVGDNVHRLRTGSIQRGMILQLTWRVTQHVIQSARFLAYGDPTLIASAEYLCECAEGQPITALLTAHHRVADVMALLAISASKRSRVQLIWGAMQALAAQVSAPSSGA